MIKHRRIKTVFFGKLQSSLEGPRRIPVIAENEGRKEGIHQLKGYKIIDPPLMQIPIFLKVPKKSTRGIDGTPIPQPNANIKLGADYLIRTEPSLNYNLVYFTCLFCGGKAW